MSRKRFWIATGGLAATLMACPARTPAPPVTPPPIQVPPGCEKSQTGTYHHADNPAFRYLGQDDGGTLALAVTRAREHEEAAPDAGTTVNVVLHRTPEGFVGNTQAMTFTPGGVACPVLFPTEAVRCDDQGLTLRSVTSAALDEECHPATQGPAPVWKEQRLLRGEPAQSPDDATPQGP